MLHRLTISELTARLARREVSARDAMQACLDQVARADGAIKAFISHNPADALTQADAADKSIAAGADFAQQPLLGVPMALKDVLAVKDHPLNCCSKILGNFVSPYDATVVEKLKAALPGLKVERGGVVLTPPKKDEPKKDEPAKAEVSAEKGEPKK